MILLCFYIFILTDRIWESISILNGCRIQLVSALLMIFVSYINGKIYFRKSTTNFWIFSILIYHFLSAPLAFSPIDAFDQGIEYFKLVLVYIIMLCCTDDKVDLYIILNAFIISMVLYSVHSFSEFLNGRYVYRMGIIRMVGVGQLYSDPNGFGASLVLSIPIVLFLLKTIKIKFLRVIYFFYLLLIPICVTLTGSRSSFIAMLLSLILWIIYTKSFKRKLIPAAISLIVIVAIWQMMPFDKQNRIRTLWDDNAGPQSAYESSEGRMYGFLISMKMFKQNPIIGVGAGGTNYIKYRESIGETPYQAHNLYGEVLSELGIIGGFFWLGLLLTIYRNCAAPKKYFKDCHQSVELINMGNSFISIMILLLFLGVGAHNFYRPHWLFLAAWSSSLEMISKMKLKESQTTLLT